MVKVIGITENDPITGVKYGTIEVKENVSKIRGCQGSSNTRQENSWRTYQEQIKCTHQ